MKILLVEDEPALRDELRAFLAEQGFLCEWASTYREGQEKLRLYAYDVVLLDITLPGGTGLDLMQVLKEEHPETGVLILSAKDSLRDKLTGLNRGADDYLTKPFHFEELNARLNALIRRRSFQGASRVRFQELAIDTQAKTVQAGPETLDLTRKEFELLLYLVVNKNRVVSRQAIAEHLWGDHYDSVDSLDFVYVHINNLRKKLAAVGLEDYIRTVYGMGYKLSAS
ncbi:DNA-binding response regulator, OmpR family, contains REC and winged-helix (wHTH) domain [Catalinimonas alkaloidigena]|uniref:DNA-binding response regulator, OmpR family, contains REC and winged-helix (WHTH) domain n=1 Tax=Catalinimonas alkaloidigena TaxID=1075417 RepID=A0A1G9TKA3_9BACT|nr:response regulator transcription factor [Catalinimonas alkaloidigena]SDM48157.1 DNA-binding response regulator, OmpR family, contains REC and winged-helix (wHTH) domain [Catalinimonas alkaloidigena]